MSGDRGGRGGRGGRRGRGGRAGGRGGRRPQEVNPCKAPDETILKWPWPQIDTPYTPSENLMGADGGWKPAPVERWADDKVYITDELICDWNTKTKAQLDKFDSLPSWTLTLIVDDASVNNMAVFTTAVEPPTDIAFGKKVIMEHMVPRYWTEHESYVNDFWTHHKTAPPHQDDIDLHQVTPWWMQYATVTDNFLPPFHYPEVKCDFNTPFPNESRKEAEARQREHTTSGAAQVYKRRMTRRLQDEKERRLFYAQSCVDDAKLRRRAARIAGAPPIKYFQPGVGPIAPNRAPLSDRATKTKDEARAIRGSPRTRQDNDGAKCEGAPKDDQAVARDDETDDWSIPSHTLKPKLRLGVRKAADMDVPALTSIYNHYITSRASCAVAEVDPITNGEMFRHLQTARAGNFPFLVAVKLPDGSSDQDSGPQARKISQWPEQSPPDLNDWNYGNRGHGRRGHGGRGRGGANHVSDDNYGRCGWTRGKPSAPLQPNGPVVGFIYASTHSKERDMFCFTVDLKFFVANTHIRQGIGAVLLDACMPLLDKHFPQQRGYDLQDGLENWNGITKVAKSINVSIPTFAKPLAAVDGTVWCAEWLQRKLGFERIGVMADVGVKDDRPVDVVLLQRRTEEVVAQGKVRPPSEPW